MKLSTKPISSPGRTDKFPPPLMRFLRSNAGSRSRRSRSSPMFVRKKNSNNSATIETQEPSSPKVTCMGQVRVRRSSKQAPSKRDRAPTRCRCWWWIRKPNPCLCRPLWPNWPFFRRKPTKLKQDSTVSDSNLKSTYDSDHEDHDSVYQERLNVNNAFASNSSTPPRNALLLTRCRSAPYRSSSLASRFWGSPMKTDEPELPAQEPGSVRHSLSDQSGKTNPETQPKLGVFKELQDSPEQRIASISKLENGDELSKGRDSAPRPVVLTRCKSEPARTGHRLDPEVSSV